MSLLTVRRELELAVAAMSTGQVASAFDNVYYKPVPGVPFQRVSILPALPQNPTQGDGFYRERGILQLALYWPLDTGTGAALEWAQTIRTTFYRTRTFVSGGVTILIEATPEIMPGLIDGDRYLIPVRVRYFANVLP